MNFLAEKIDKAGRLIEQRTRVKIKELLESLVSWKRRLKA
jgi:hypothetical protein